MTNTFTKTTFILALSVALSFGTTVFAAETEEDDDPHGDWRTSVQMHLDNGHYDIALERLEAVRTDNEASSADWNNFIGYAFRKQETPDLISAENHYKKALELYADHRGALEYYGELKLIQKDLPAAKALLKTLQAACPEGCAELDDLLASIAEYKE